MCCAKISLALPLISNFVPVGYEGYVKEHIPSKYCRAWGGFEDCVMGGANGPCRVVKEDNDVVGVTESAILISAVCNICPRT